MVQEMDQGVIEGAMGGAREQLKVRRMVQAVDLGSTEEAMDDSSDGSGSN